MTPRVCSKKNSLFSLKFKSFDFNSWNVTLFSLSSGTLHFEGTAYWACQSLKPQPSIRCAYIFFIYEKSHICKWTLVLLCEHCTSHAANFTSLRLVFFFKDFCFSLLRPGCKSWSTFPKKRHNYSLMENVFQIIYL